MTIRADLHVHSKVCNESTFSLQHFESTVERARHMGLSGFALTEHMHAPGYWNTLNELVRRYGYRDGHFALADGFNVLTGAELTVAERVDVILIGGIDQLRQFDRSFVAMPSQGYLPRLDDVFDPAREAGLVMIAAHPTRQGKSTVEAGRGHLGLFDALEINGKDVALRRVEPEIRRLAAHFDLPVVGGSDAHVWPQVGVQSTVLALSELTQQGLRQCLARREASTETAPGIDSLVRISKAHKSIVKQRLSAVRGRRPVAAYSGRRRLIGAPAPA